MKAASSKIPKRNPLKSKLVCSSCGKVVPTTKDARQHPVLKTLQCLACNIAYLSVGDLSKYRRGVELNGQDNYCRWCLDGGDLIICADETCRSQFCDYCIDRNLGPKSLKKIREDTKWHCFVCDSKQLESLKVEPRTFRAFSPIPIPKIEPPIVLTILKSNSTNSGRGPKRNQNDLKERELSKKSKAVRFVKPIEEVDHQDEKNDLSKPAESNHDANSNSTPSKRGSIRHQDDPQERELSKKDKMVPVIKPTEEVDHPNEKNEDPKSTDSNHDIINQSQKSTPKTNVVVESVDRKKDEPIEPSEMPRMINGTPKTSVVVESVDRKKDEPIEPSKMPRMINGTIRVNLGLFSTSRLFTMTPTKSIAQPPKIQPPETQPPEVQSSPSVRQQPVPPVEVAQPPEDAPPLELPPPPPEVVSAVKLTKVSSAHDAGDTLTPDALKMLSDELTLSDDESCDDNTAYRTPENSPEIGTRPAKRKRGDSPEDEVKTWAIKSASLLHKRLGVLIKSLSTLHDDFDENQFYDDISNLTSWTSNLQAFLSSGPHIYDRCQNLCKFVLDSQVE